MSDNNIPSVETSAQDPDKPVQKIHKPHPGKTYWDRTNEFRRLADALWYIHAVFSQIHELGSYPVWTEDPRMASACIRFDFKYGTEPVFMFNSGFWDYLDDYTRAFVTCHECLHVLLNHGRRLTTIAIDYPWMMPLANIAADLVINHSLVENFGFDRSRVKDAEDACWVDKVFPDDPSVPTNECFEYYLSKLINTAQVMVSSGSAEDKEAAAKSIGGQFLSMDDHSTLANGQNDVSSPENGKKIKEFIDNLAEKSSPTDLEKLQDPMKNFDEGPIGNDPCSCRQAGSSPGNIMRYVKKKKPVPKRKWETIIKKWERGFLPTYVSETQWAMPHRRLQAIPCGNLMLPSDHDVINKKAEMVEVWCFQDTSGSCAHLAERFFNALRTLPPDKFMVKLFCFDTKIYETDLKSGKLYGFGGTSFRIISEHIYREMNRMGSTKFPHTFILTDGYGDMPTIQAEHRKRVHWFLSEPYKSCIPDGCPTYNLADYE